MKTYKFLISGKVQGVWYRKFVSEKAKNRGFRGYIKNLPDGRVEAVANIEDKNRLKEFLEILKEGSPYSVVEKIEYKELPFQDFSDFNIRY